MGRGTYCRWNTKDTTDSQHRVDIRYLRQHGMLRPGQAGSLAWSRGDRETGRIGFVVMADRVILSYRYRCNGGEWQDVTEPVPLVYTACNYGGCRPWFICPAVGCGRRVAVLYGAGQYFACRRCHDLAYESQREDKMNRALSKAQEIRHRLGGSRSMLDPFPEKPKAMHWRTYDRLLRRAHEAEHVYHVEMMGWLDRNEVRAGARLYEASGPAGTA